MSKNNSSNDSITLDDLAAMTQAGFTEVNEKFKEVNEKMSKGFTEVNEKFKEVNEKMGIGFEESKQRDEHLQKQIDNVVGDVSQIKTVIKRLPQQKDFVALKKRVYVVEQHVFKT